MKLSISIILGFLSSVPTCMVVSGFQVLPSTRNHVLVTRQSQEPHFTASVVPRTTTMTSSRSHSPTALYVFGGLFGGKVALSEEPLTIYSTTKSADIDNQYEALGEYLEEWSKLLTNGSIKLTTPVTVELVVPKNEDGTTTSNDGRRGIRFLFKDTKTGYKSKTEEDESNPKSTVSSEDTQADNQKKQAASKVKQGGVEILVEKNKNGVQVTAKRCEFEEDTIIKEMSEDTILHELKQAIEVWKRETKQ